MHVERRDHDLVGRVGYKVIEVKSLIGYIETVVLVTIGSSVGESVHADGVHVSTGSSPVKGNL